jgi:hypothetical protein
MKLSTLRNKSVKCSVTLGDDTLNFTHDPSRFTPRFYQEVLSEDGTGKARDLAVFLAALVTEWDLTDDAGAPYPLTVDALCDLPVEFLGEVVKSINETNNPKPTSSAASSYS